ncbi:hypothetical protein BJF88_00450 [Cellulosimicrobium sp. CUA-896]|nr:hypothetical protein BJF88_00450 [Cellulosimicrobium sp. CUA-896]
MDLGGRPRQRDLPERLGEQAAGGVHVVVVEGEVEQVAQLVDAQPGRHAQPPVAEVLDLGLGPVVLVGQLPDDLLERVLDRHQPGDAAVLVDDHRDVRGRRLHLAQEVVHRLGLGHEDRGPRDLADRSVPFPGHGVQHAHDVLEVRDADEVVGRRAGDRHAREPRPQEQGEHLAQRRVPRRRDHVGTRHHDLARERAAELEHRADELALLVLDDLGLVDAVHHVAELALVRAGVRGGCEPREPPGRPGERRERPGEREEHAHGVPPAERARARPHHHEPDDDAHHERDEQHLPPRVEPGGDEQRQARDRRDLRDDAHEAHRPRGRAGVGEQRQRPPGARARGPGRVVAGRLEDRGARDPQHGRLPGAEHRREGGRQDGQRREERDGSAAHRPARKVRRSLRWSANISFSSSGSTWS